MSDVNDKKFDSFIKKNTEFLKDSSKNEWSLIHQKINEVDDLKTNSFWNSPWLLVASTTFSLFLIFANLPNQETTNEIDSLINMTFSNDSSWSSSESLYSIDDIQDTYYN